MEKIGTIRRIDELGRIVIPKLIRNKMRLKEGDRVVVSYNIEDDTVTVSICSLSISMPSCQCGISVFALAVSFL